MKQLGCVAAALLFWLAACSERAAAPQFHHAENPSLLSEWGAVVVRGGALELGEGVLPYDLNTPLFTDYAHKLRTVWTPGGAAPYQEEKALDLPIGTVITKTFYYPQGGGRVLQTADHSLVHAGQGLDLRDHRLIETRLLVRRTDGWHAVSYVWNDEQTDAVLTRVGALIPLTLASADGEQDFPYVVPNTNQCAACHAHDATTKIVEPLGPRVGQLNKDYAYATGSANQLTRWIEAGLLSTAPVQPALDVAWDDRSASLSLRARSYLAANCGHCHNPRGPADTSGLDLTLASSGPALGHCKPPIAAGSGTGGRRYSIDPGAPENSILVYRMASTDPGAMMPELGRALRHEAGVGLMTEWIAAMEGGCS